ncbi:MAG: sensor histidine kinase [Bosea sp.]|uniref:sensor histidine kinase n=1 Tax=Bosea sp. (in: a-proteobacteria) TaxID=1871050 RepID=UPI00239C79DC|nr:sensor histidine kinase [Bosea sp. (in: a-proteobacteria)]MCP4737779.1 sensor histidine kinase [Bosea sp. (in: a-proteobacteria)]
MRTGSLRLRLALSAFGLIALALALAGGGLVVIFDRALDARTAEELDLTAKYLAGQAAIAPDGALTLTASSPDARFATPYGGLYWQIAAGTGGELRSRSLWDRRLATDAVSKPEPGRAFDLAGPNDQRLIAVSRPVVIEHAGRETPLQVVVAMDRGNLAATRSAFLHLLVPSLVALGLVLAAAMALFVQRALAPFRTLQADLTAIHEGQATKLPARFPAEVQPLVDDLNRLIGAQERALLKARTEAGDMAHGLKTPLAILTALARRTADAQPEIAREVEEEAAAMSRQVERALARARIVASRDLRRRSCNVAPVAERLVATLQRLPDADSLIWTVAVPAELTYPGEDGDLTEMLGNLLDNARKWAHRRVSIQAFGDEAEQVLRIEDDGPGMSEAAMSRIGRGLRWDETTPGTGFGIAIAADIAEETGATLTLSCSPLGGLRADLAWPRDLSPG